MWKWWFRFSKVIETQRLVGQCSGLNEGYRGQTGSDRDRTEQVSAWRSRDHQTLQETDTTSLRSIQKHLFIWKCTNTAFISSNFNFIESSQEKQLNIKMWLNCLNDWLSIVSFGLILRTLEAKVTSESNLMHVPRPTFENENRMNLHTEEEKEEKKKCIETFDLKQISINTKEQQVTHWVKQRVPSND